MAVAKPVCAALCRRQRPGEERRPAVPSELDTANQLNVPRTCDGTTPVSKVNVADTGIEVLAPTLRRACEIMQVEGVKSLGTNKETDPLRDMSSLAERDVDILEWEAAVPRNARSHAIVGTGGECAHGFERTHVK